MLYFVIRIYITKTQFDRSFFPYPENGRSKSLVKDKITSQTLRYHILEDLTLHIYHFANFIFQYIATQHCGKTWFQELYLSHGLKVS